VFRLSIVHSDLQDQFFVRWCTGSGTRHEEILAFQGRTCRRIAEAKNDTFNNFLRWLDVRDVGTVFLQSSTIRPWVNPDACIFLDWMKSGSLQKGSHKEDRFAFQIRVWPSITAGHRGEVLRSGSLGEKPPLAWWDLSLYAWRVEKKLGRMWRLTCWLVWRMAYSTKSFAKSRLLTASK